jgi:hypothetical protein
MGALASFSSKLESMFDSETNPIAFPNDAENRALCETENSVPISVTSHISSGISSSNLAHKVSKSLHPTYIRSIRFQGGRRSKKETYP